jgi:ABC transport system ATP-binding/permease protein
MAPPLIHLRDVGLTFGGAALLDGAEISVATGERVALVGRNGSGKSTLLRIAAGLVEPDRGSRFLQPGATLRYLPQEPDFGDFTTVLAYVEDGLTPGDDAHQARYLIEQLGLTGDEHPASLSGGEARRAAIAKVLAPSPDILLLDEPTNHLDLATIEWLEAELASRRCALVIISHDRRFLDRLARTTIWLDRGTTRRLELSFSAFEERRDEILAQEEVDRHKLDRRIEAEEHWLRYGVTARRKRNVRRLGQLQSLRTDRRDERKATGNVTLAASESESSGKLVIEAKNISKHWGPRPIVDGFSIRIKRGDRIGVVGPNGAGKTTLISLLTGALKPDAGHVKLGANLDMATLDQHRESLDPEWTLAEAMTGGRGDFVTIGGQSKHVIGYMKDFLFTPEQVRTPLRVLSGGERGRLTLARALAKPSNLLVLDEPTNDLDLETLDVLEEMIGDYNGTVILISHDRDFLDRVVNAVIVPEGNGKWREYAGGYSDMLNQRKAEIVRDTGPKSGGGRGSGTGEGRVGKPAQRGKLTFKDKHALETLPRDMDRLTREMGILQRRLDDPQLFTRDRKAFDTLSAKLADQAAELAKAEERWLELEMLREETEGV